MSIASRITAITGHIGDIYDTLELGGDTTENKNIVNINTEIKREYKDFLAHGTDELWNNWEKVEGEGTQLSLSPTIKGKMKVDLKGNTQQAILPSGYTQVEYIQSSGTQYIDTGYTYNDNLNIDIKFQALDTANQYYGVFGARTTYGSNQFVVSYQGYAKEIAFNYGAADTGAISGANVENISRLYNSGKNFYLDNTNIYSFNSGCGTGTRNCYLFTFIKDDGTLYNKSSIKLYYFKMYNGTNLLRDMIPCYRNSDNEVGLYDLVSNTFYGNSGTGSFTYGSVVPNPDYPQDIQVVSGDNSIKVENDNLYKYGDYDVNTSYYFVEKLLLNNFENNTTYTFSADVNITRTPFDVSIGYGNNGFQADGPLLTNQNNGRITFTFTTNNSNYNNLYIRVPRYGTTGDVSGTVKNIKLEKRNQATPYTPYISQEHQISLAPQLFDISTITPSKYIDSLGALQTSSYTDTSDYIAVQANKEYSITWNYDTLINIGTREMAYYNTSKTFISRKINISMQDRINKFTPTQDGYIRFDYDKNCYNIVMCCPSDGIELCKIGTYQDSIVKDNGKWYLNKQIGKVAFSDLIFNEIGGNFSQFSTNGNIAMVYLQNDLKVTGNRDDVFCNLLKPYSSSLFGGLQTGINQYYNATKLLLSVPLANVEEFAGETLTVNNYLSYTQNYIKGLEGYIYYVLATPTYTEITGELLSQLNALAYSYEGTTNISQVNDDLAFVLDITALKEMS